MKYIILIYICSYNIAIRNYMDYCQDQLTDFRKHKVELNKESKAL